MDEMTLTLDNPITEEQWDAITDVDFEHTNEITFHTKHGKIVKFIKESVRPEQHWIPCSDKFPSPCVVVLVQTKYSVIATAYYKDGKWYSYPQWGEYTSDGWKQKDLLIDSVIAWMPLPEPWRGEQYE